MQAVWCRTCPCIMHMAFMTSIDMKVHCNFHRPLASWDRLRAKGVHTCPSPMYLSMALGRIILFRKLPKPRRVGFCLFGNSVFDVTNYISSSLRPTQSPQTYGVMSLTPSICSLIYSICSQFFLGSAGQRVCW